MIIDLLLDRQDGIPYSPRVFYTSVSEYESLFDTGYTISTALDSGTNSDVIQSLTNYINANDYNPDIIDYIKSVSWV